MDSIPEIHVIDQHDHEGGGRPEAAAGSLHSKRASRH